MVDLSHANIHCKYLNAKKLCEKVSMLANGCRDSGQFCSVMDCSQSSTKIVCAKSCG